MDTELKRIIAIDGQHVLKRPEESYLEYEKLRAKCVLDLRRKGIVVTRNKLKK